MFVKALALESGQFVLSQLRNLGSRDLNSSGGVELVIEAMIDSSVSLLMVEKGEFLVGDGCYQH